MPDHHDVVRRVQLELEAGRLRALALRQNHALVMVEPRPTVTTPYRTTPYSDALRLASWLAF